MLPGVQWKIKEPISIIYKISIINHRWSTINSSSYKKHSTKQVETVCTMDKGHYITYPNSALLQGKSLKFTITLHCLIPPKWVSSNDPQNGTFSVSHNSILNRHELLHIEGQSSIITGSSRGNSNPSVFILKVFWLPLPPWCDNNTATSRKRICLFQSFHVGKSQGTRMYGCIWMRLDAYIYIYYACLSMPVGKKLIETCSSKKHISTAQLRYI